MSGDNKVAKIMHQLFDSVKSIKTVQYKITAIERLSKEFVTAHSEIKLQMHPRKVYFNNPTKKIEILYNPEMNATKALIRTASIPYVSVLLDPTGSLVRKNQHYTIYELGFDFIARSIALTINKDKFGINNFTLHGTCNKNGFKCYFIEYENPNFNYIDYVVGSKETISSIASKLNVNEHIIRYKNNMMNTFGYLKHGEVLKTPTLYCKKAIIYVDEKLMLPVSISLYDDVGLFESYDFHSIEINKHFSDIDFDKKNPQYNF